MSSICRVDYSSFHSFLLEGVVQRIHYFIRLNGNFCDFLSLLLMDGMKLGCETPQVPSPEAVGFLVNSRSVSGRSSSFRGEIPSKLRQDFGLVN